MEATENFTLVAATGGAVFPLVLVSTRSSRLTHDLIFRPGEARSQCVQGMHFTIHPLKTTIRWNCVDIQVNRARVLIARVKAGIQGADAWAPGLREGSKPETRNRKLEVGN